MKKQTKEKKIEEKCEKIRDKYLEEVNDYFESSFPKGSKKRGVALCLTALAFINGIQAGEALAKLK